MYNSTVVIPMTSLERLGKQILYTLNTAGYEAYFVGGFVRDKLLKRPLNDVDITTAATPDIVATLFKKTVPTGAAFGTITVILEGHPFEITTYRKETTYDNHRHPDRIRFAETVAEDLSRRDFTINQLIMNHEGKIIDHHAGLDDLEAEIVRTIGDANSRFQEDALRILRALRFAAQLSFSIHPETETAIKENRALLAHLSSERVQEELVKLFDAEAKAPVLEKMLVLGVGETLGFSETLKTFLEVRSSFDSTDFFIVMHSKHEFDETYYRLSKTFVKTIKDGAALLNRRKTKPFEARDLFDYGFKLCERIAKLIHALGFSDQRKHIRNLADTLPIHTLEELAYRGRHIKNELNPDHPRHIAIVQDILLNKVLDRSLPNRYTDLKTAAITILNSIKSE